MPIAFSCPHCNKQMNVADQYAGQTGACQSCGQQITIPLDPGGFSMMGKPPKGKSAGSAGLIITIIAVAGVGFLLCGGIAVALLLPAVSTAREAARRTQCNNNLKQILLALHNYHDVHKTFPPAYLADSNGKPMHSWRVLILPYLEAGHIYSQYNFDEPWDSPGNRYVAELMLPVFRCPSDGSQMGGMSYVLVTGKGTMFDGEKGIGIPQITDGTNQTLAIVEVKGAGIEWTEPRDLDIEQFTRLFGPRSDPRLMSHPRGFNAGMADGSVRFIQQGVDESQLRAMASPAGGDTVNP